MHKLISITALGVMFAGSVVANDIGMEEQKRQIEMNERAAMSGRAPDGNNTNEITIQEGRDMVGTPLDNAKGESSFGKDHIIETGEPMPPADDHPMVNDGRTE